MSIVELPDAQYINERLKGSFYWGPSTMPSTKIVLVRPLYDGPLNDNIDATIVPFDKMSDAFNHSGFTELKLKPDEEFTMSKSKHRRLLATSNPINGLIRVAPIYTIKDYHQKEYDMVKMKENKIRGLFYLKETEHNKEAFVPLIEAQYMNVKLLKPIRLRLNKSGLTILDDHTVDILGIYSHVDETDTL